MLDGEVGQKITSPSLAFCHKLIPVQSCQSSQYDFKGKKGKKKVDNLHLLKMLPITVEDVRVFSDDKETQMLMPF